MIEKALDSIFVIDGISQEFTPNQLLGRVQSPNNETINDETIDPPVSPQKACDEDMDYYLGLDLSTSSFPLCYSASYTRLALATSLLSSLLKEGRFRLGNLELKLRWHWDDSCLGSMAAFYESVRNVAEYADELGISIDEYSLNSSSTNELEIENSIFLSCEDQSLDPYVLDNASIRSYNHCPWKLTKDANSWIIYIPFDTADFRLGGSALLRKLAYGGAQVNLNDADYFIDCFEVVREFVEDDILLSAAYVGEGGLATTLKSILNDEWGLTADISALVSSYQNCSRTEILFGEVPGVVIQIQDSDFDYIDAQLLLQDVAYFPLGHPEKNGGKLEISSKRKSGIQTILESLILNAEGED